MISGGEIKNGQGAASITIELGKSDLLTTTVDVEGLPPHCPNVAAGSVSYTPRPQSLKISEIAGTSKFAKRVKTTKYKTKKRIVRKTSNRFN